MSQSPTTSPLPSLIKGVAITPPILGRISMGHVEMRGKPGSEKAIPHKDDFFTITGLIQNADRTWPDHPIQAKLKGQDKLVAIPVRLAFNDPTLTISNSYCVFDSGKGRARCAGNGNTARRMTQEGVVDIDCPRPESCTYGQENRCKSMTRAYFQIDGQDDELGFFVLRSSGWNTLTTLASRLSRLHGISNGKLAGMPLSLVLRGKSTTASYRRPVYYADLVQRESMSLIETVKAATDYQDILTAAGLNLEGLEAAARLGLANGAFADEIEDADEWLSDEELLAQASGNVGVTGVSAQGLKGLDAIVARQASGQSHLPEQQHTGDPLPKSTEQTQPPATV